MAAQLERTANSHLIRFGPELNIFTVKEDFDALQCLQHEALSTLVIDLSQVGDFDSAGLQLLLWLRQHLLSEQPIHWMGLDNEIIRKVTELFRLSLSDGIDVSAAEM